MKRNLPLTLIVLVLVFSCIDDNDQLDDCLKSLLTWERLKAEHGNSYKYQTKFQSWTGYGHTTDLTITNGAVTRRAYEAYLISDTGSKEIMDSYLEDASQLGSHEEGSPVATLEDLYRTCGQDLKVSERTNSRIFTTDELGIVRSCGYVPDNCADDCFHGFSISSFEWL